MESSSSQNFKKNGTDSQSPPEGEADSEQSNPLEAKESLEGNNPIDKAETREKASCSEPLQNINLEQLDVITSEKDIKRMTIPNKPIDGVDVNEAAEQLSTSIERIRFTSPEKDINKTRKTSFRTFLENPKKLAVIFSYASSNRQRQPFRPQPRTRPPDPPHYYTSSVRQREQPPSRPEGNRQVHQGQQNSPQPHSQSETQSPRQPQPQPQPQSQPQFQGESHPQFQAQLREYRYDVPRYIPLSQLAMFPYILTHPATWAHYPTRIPDSVAPTLAQLLDAEVLFVIQQLDIIELMTDVVEPNFYLILNKHGECVYYAYETSNLFPQSCCGHTRSFQLHIVDLYQNEVIFMNRLSGCTYLFCCYPAIEVYSPPTVPVGAVTKICKGSTQRFVIIDADENIMFTIEGDRTFATYFGFAGVDVTIHALDSNKTQVGFIRREFVPSPLAYQANIDYYGLSFPGNMDVKIKALFLGALFLISLKRTGWVLRNVEDPETISGHMYRMSIMTFLIPESSGVDKTKCMKLSLVHDLAECIVGDLTPYCGVDANEKHRQEEVAMKELTKMIGVSGAEIYTLYKEYEAQVTDESKFVKDLDRLDMILQAFEYEKLGDKPGKLEEFFTSTFNKFHFPWTIDIVKEIYKQRNLHINKEKSLGKDP